MTFWSNRLAALTSSSGICEELFLVISTASSGVFRRNKVWSRLGRGLRGRVLARLRAGSCRRLSGSLQVPGSGVSDQVKKPRQPYD